MRLRVCALACFLSGFSALRMAGETTSGGPAIVGYVFPNGAALKPGQIDTHNLTRINYAFAATKYGRITAGSAVDEQNLAILVALKKENPSLSVLIAVGGWLGSGDFSDIALTEKSRKVFVDSAMEFLYRYHLDGLDIDWEYPGLPGAGNTFRAGDKETFTLLVEELHRRFNDREKTDGKHFYLTIAAGASEEYLAHTEMKQMQPYLDAVNLMAYDYNEAFNGVTSHVAPLFTEPGAPDTGSVDASVRAFEHAGVPAGKLILGVPFYGRLWEDVNSAHHGLFQPGKPAKSDSIPFNVIASTMMGREFARYWDAAASVPYLYNSVQRVFVSYEDTESIAAKCQYVLSRKLGGVMFWEYSDDAKGVLLGAISHGLRPSISGAH